MTIFRNFIASALLASALPALAGAFSAHVETAAQGVTVHLINTSAQTAYAVDLGLGPAASDDSRHLGELAAGAVTLVQLPNSAVGQAGDGSLLTIDYIDTDGNPQRETVRAEEL